MNDHRKNLDVKYTWDLSTIFETDEAWESEFALLFEEVNRAKDYTGHLLDSAKTLYDITLDKLECERRIMNVFVYAHMKNDQDTTVSAYQEAFSKASGLIAKFSENYSFYEPELLKADEAKICRYIEEEPKLEVYRFYFEKLLKTKEHVLSESEERILAASLEIFRSAHETFGILDNADMQFGRVRDDNGEEIELTHANYIRFMESKNRDVRKNAYESLYRAYRQFARTYAKILQTNVKVQNLNAKLRKYACAREAALSANFVPEKVYDTLVNTVNRHLPLLHRYVDLRKKLLGLDDLKMYDMYTPLSDLDMKYTYEEAVKKSMEILAVYGEDYAKRVQRSFTERWIDVYPNKGKRSGAYSGGSYDTNAFMLLNWQDNPDNLYTLVHEVGHSMHSTFSRENQPYVYGDYSIFLAEIASTTNENILTENLLKETDDEKIRFAILNKFLDGFRGTVFRQTQFAQFEQAIHEADARGEVLTSEYLCRIYSELNEKFYGLGRDDNEEIQYEWARIPHFYYNYYVFQYSTGFCAALAFSEKILHGGDEDREKYLGFLKSGSSDYPLEVIRKAGLDMESEDYLNAAFAVFERRLNEFEALVKKGIR